MIDDPCLLVGRRLRALRNARNLTLRDLSERSGVSINTISLIERGETSPTVSTLHKLAGALGVMIADFVAEEPDRKVIFLKREQRKPFCGAATLIESLGTGLTDQLMDPLVVTVEPKASCGSDPLVHLGHELVFCLEGELVYEVDGVEYVLEPGDSLLFEAHLPHSWRNAHTTPAKVLLVLQAPEGYQGASNRHF
jgi:transcriptional regulator with XRE-family HTH domain